MDWDEWKLRPNAPEVGLVLCALEDIPDRQAKGFEFGETPEVFRMFVVRDYRNAYGYINECPHICTPLECYEDEFIDMSNSFIICSSHGALFQFEDGLCIMGPCVNQSLYPVPIRLEEGNVIIGSS